MPELTPKHAAELAGDVYLVQTDNQVPLFMSHQLFQTQGQAPADSHVHLKAKVGGRLVLNTEDGFGICAKGGDTHNNDLFLIFRGTTMANKRADVLTDARIGLILNTSGLPVHCGFHHCFSSMLPKIKDFLTNHVDTTRIETVHCIGHSLGGAVATLAADWISKNTTHTTKLYTFGCPRVGTSTFAKTAGRRIGANNIHRVYHRTDPVPMVPLYPFMHTPYASYGHYIYSVQPLSSGIAHKMANYLESVGEKYWDQLSEVPDEPYTLETAIQQWLESKLPINSNCPTFWRWVDSALIYVIRKITMSALMMLEATFIGVFTIADRIAYILAEGIKLADKIGTWVMLLMRKLMQALHLTAPRNKEELTQSTIRAVLDQMNKKSNSDARNAIGHL